MPCCKKLLLTGATGLIGKELISPLKELGYEIYAITREKRENANGVEFITGDLFDNSFVESVFEKFKPEYLLNMAWATTGDYLSSDINYNFLSTSINMLKYFKNNDGKRAVFAGTCFEYDFNNEPLKENDKLAPDKTVYTFCKNKLHEIAEYFCKKNDISFGWGRIFYVYGRNENKTRLTGMVIDKLSNNEEVVIKSGPLQKDYMYTKDIAGAFAKFLDSNVEGAVNICTGNAISIRDFTSEIACQMGKENLLIFRDEQSNQPPIIVGDNSRLLNEVLYTPKYTAKQGIKDILTENGND